MNGHFFVLTELGFHIKFFPINFSPRAGGLAISGKLLAAEDSKYMCPCMSRVSGTKVYSIQVMGEVVDGSRRGPELGSSEVN